jgi:NitT/TauT family transport system substrate-binding protein
MRTVEGTKGRWAGRTRRRRCTAILTWRSATTTRVHKLANAFVGTLRWISQHSAEEITATMPASYNGGNQAL